VFSERSLVEKLIREALEEKFQTVEAQRRYFFRAMVLAAVGVVVGCLLVLRK
jgi:hypothetical protein